MNNSFKDQKDKVYNGEMFKSQNEIDNNSILDQFLSMSLPVIMQDFEQYLNENEEVNETAQTAKADGKTGNIKKEQDYNQYKQQNVIQKKQDYNQSLIFDNQYSNSAHRYLNENIDTSNFSFDTDLLLCNINNEAPLDEQIDEVERQILQCNNQVNKIKKLRDNQIKLYVQKIDDQRRKVFNLEVQLNITEKSYIQAFGISQTMHLLCGNHPINFPQEANLQDINNHNKNLNSALQRYLDEAAALQYKILNLESEINELKDSIQISEDKLIKSKAAKELLENNQVKDAKLADYSNLKQQNDILQKKYNAIMSANSGDVSFIIIILALSDKLKSEINTQQSSEEQRQLEDNFVNRMKESFEAVNSNMSEQDKKLSFDASNCRAFYKIITRDDIDIKNFKDLPKNNWGAFFREFIRWILFLPKVCEWSKNVTPESGWRLWQSQNEINDRASMFANSASGYADRVIEEYKTKISSVNSIE